MLRAGQNYILKTEYTLKRWLKNMSIRLRFVKTLSDFKILIRFCKTLSDFVKPYEEKKRYFLEISTQKPYEEGQKSMRMG